MQFNDRMYYPCKLCGSRSNPKWHKPGTNVYDQHKGHIDVDELNVERPAYFWCTNCNTPHHLKRECLPYKAIIEVNGSSGQPNGITKLSHGDILIEINEKVLAGTELHNWKDKIGTRSLPWPTTREDKLIHPDIIYCKEDSSVKFGYSITHIVEFETATSASSIADKIRRFNESFKEMFECNAQDRNQLPKIIFIYDDHSNISTHEVKLIANDLDQEYLGDVVINHYKEDWFKHLGVL